MKSLPLALLPLALLLACSPAEVAEGEAQQSPQLPAPEVGESPDPGENCLLLVWSEQDAPDVEFDRTHDTVKGGAISCATGTSASQFEAAIAALRDAARSGDKERLLREVGIPLLYIDAKGDRRELTGDEIDTLFDEVFDARMIALLQNLDLSQMTVEKDQGAFFELGSLWLVVDATGGRPRVVTVNRQALGEAAEAARRQADKGRGQILD
ncbi:hypothetical protein KUV75_00760 [Qipengyuania gaetbuli]|uniref:hypothetical protein n=1 Tax=Qipengyuania gaetbuli TaxID=266952 RepID=UPI001C998448|nr:hypothetical protein [Qipengyuania gaetbuli]MBY6013436.1 hypothetical protein [Qipengyuania gaetbuli]